MAFSHDLKRAILKFVPKDCPILNFISPSFVTNSLFVSFRLKAIKLYKNYKTGVNIKGKFLQKFEPFKPMFDLIFFSLLSE